MKKTKKQRQNKKQDKLHTKNNNSKKTIKYKKQTNKQIL